MIVNKYQGQGGGSGSGSTVSVNQILSAGTQIASIQVDNQTTTLYAPEGGGITAYYFNEMTQAELAALYTLLETEAGRPDTEGVLSANTINEKYAFFNDFANPATVPPDMEYIKLQFYGFYYGRAVFTQTLAKAESANGVNNYLVWLRSDGTFERMNRYQKDFPTKGTEAVGYFNDFNNYIVYNKGNNTFTDKDGNALTNGSNFGGSIYWFVMHPIQGDWGNGIPTVPFKVIDADSAETMHYYASVEMETLDTPITIDGVEYTEKFAFKYPDFTFSGYVNSNPQYANLAFTPENGGQGGTSKSYVLNEMTQQERKDLYDELVVWRNDNTGGILSGFPAGDYSFFVNVDFGDEYRGIIPLSISFMHPSDYGGAIFFDGVVGDRRNYPISYIERYVIISDGSADTNRLAVGGHQFSTFNYSWIGRMSYDADNSVFKRGDTTLAADTSYDSFEASNTIDYMIDRGGREDDYPAFSLYMPIFPIYVISGGTEQKYTSPKIIGKNISSTTVDGQTYTRQYFYIYDKEDGSRFIISCLLNNNNNAANFTYTAV